MATQPIQDSAKTLPNGEYSVIDNGPAITAVPTALAGVPVPFNPGAVAQGQNVYQNGTIPGYLVNPQYTVVPSVVAAGTKDLAIRFQNPAGSDNASRPPTAPVFVQGQALTSSNTIVFASDNTAGNMIIVCAEDSGFNDTLTVSDSIGNNYTLIRKDVNPAIYQCNMWYATNIGAGPNTVTLAGAGGFRRLAAHEFSGLGPSPRIATSAATSDTTGSTLTSGPMTLPAAPQFIFGFAFHGSLAFMVPGPNFQQALSIIDVLTEYRFIQEAGTYSATASINGSSFWTMQAVSFLF